MQHSKTKKQLSFIMLLALVVGNMVGSGVFLLPAALAPYGFFSIYGWLVSGIGAISIALIFGRLSKIMPLTGGPYAYCRRAFGDFIGFQIAYIYWVYTWVGNAAIAISVTGYLSYFFPVLNVNFLLAFLTTIVIVWLLSLVNILGVRKAGTLQVMTVAAKLIPILCLGLYGLTYIKPSEILHVLNLHSDYGFAGSAALSSIALTMWAFTGVESATIPAASVANPTRNIPLATILGTIISLIIYVITTLAIMSIVPAADLAKDAAPFTTVATMLFGKAGGIIIGLAAIVSATGALNGWILLQGQVPLAAATDQLFPPAFKHMSRYDTPKVGIIVSSILISILLFFNFQKDLVQIFTFVILLATATVLLVYWFVIVADVIIAVQQNTVSAKLLINLLAAVYIIFAIISSGAITVYYSILLFLSGMPMYVWLVWQYRRRSSKVPHFPEMSSNRTH